MTKRLGTLIATLFALVALPALLAALEHAAKH